MVEILVASVIGLVLVVGPLAWRVARDRSESRALSIRAYVQSLVDRKLGGESFVSVQVTPRGLWSVGQVVVAVPGGWGTLEEWFEFYGVKVSRGVAILFKAVDPEFVSSRGCKYEPGSTPEAADWDGGVAECGGGLHFAPSAGHAREWRSGWDTRFVACPVRVSEIVFHPNGVYMQKVKARRVCKPCWEVDVHGDKVEAA